MDSEVTWIFLEQRIFFGGWEKWSEEVVVGKKQRTEEIQQGSQSIGLALAA